MRSSSVGPQHKRRSWLSHPFIDMLNHRLTAEVCQRFSFKSCRLVTGRDKYQTTFISGGRISASNERHNHEPNLRGLECHGHPASGAYPLLLPLILVTDHANPAACLCIRCPVSPSWPKNGTNPNHSRFLGFSRTQVEDAVHFDMSQQPPHHLHTVLHVNKIRTCSPSPYSFL